MIVSHAGVSGATHRKGGVVARVGSIIPIIVVVVVRALAVFALKGFEVYGLVIVLLGRGSGQS